MPPKRVGGILPESVNRGSVVSPGVETPYQCSRVVSHQTSGWGRGYTKQGDDSHFQRDLAICMVQRDHDYCRVLHLSKSSGPTTPSCREKSPKTSDLEGFRQNLVSEEISERAAELMTGARRLCTSFNYKST